MKHTHAIDKSGEDPTECEVCGFRNGGHMADCPLAKRTDHALTEAYLASTEPRVTVEEWPVRGGIHRVRITRDALGFGRVSMLGEL